MRMIITPTIASYWMVIQQQFVHVVFDVLAHHVFQGVPCTTVEVENYVFPDGSQSSNIDNAGRYADYSVVLTHVRPFAQQLADQTSTIQVASADTMQPVAALRAEDHAIEMAPCIIDWDDTQLNSAGDPIIYYGEDDGMDMAGYTQPHEPQDFSLPYPSRSPSPASSDSTIHLGSPTPTPSFTTELGSEMSDPSMHANTSATTTTTTTPTSTSTSRKTIVKEPDVFTGDTSKFRAWLRMLLAYIHDLRRTQQVSNDNEAISVAISYI
ncbi:hypothetical protein GGU11DRAFT_751332 [Lentinula aff. detonsa]|nr:hypothetical protein GGU11DRAFT_751332 [Lentinula aff. detonsa]